VATVMGGVMADSYEQILGELGITVHRMSGREIEAECPFHPDAHPSFYMSAETGAWICFQCGASGGLQMLYEQVSGETGIGLKAALREVRQKRLRRPQEPASAEPVPDALPDTVLIQAHYRAMRTPPDWALQERSLDDATVFHYGIKWDKGWVIPIRDPQTADLWGWQFKRLDHVRNFPKSIKKSSTLFGLRELTSKIAVLVESPLDVVRLACLEVEAVASFGAMVSQAQIEILQERCDEIVLALDADEEGQRQQEKIYPVLKRHMPTRQVPFPYGKKDPGDMTDKEIIKAFK
jgi:hypothetical protein